MQQRSATAGRRPSGTDGSDFSYRMVVDSRYTRVAKGKFRLGALLAAQTASQVVWTSLMLLSASHEKKFETFAAISVSVGFISLIIGEFGRRRSHVTLLRLYAIISSIATVLSVACIIRSDLHLKRVGRGPTGLITRHVARINESRELPPFAGKLVNLHSPFDTSPAAPQPERLGSTNVLWLSQHATVSRAAVYGASQREEELALFWAPINRPCSTPAERTGSRRTQREGLRRATPGDPWAKSVRSLGFFPFRNRFSVLGFITRAWYEKAQQEPNFKQWRVSGQFFPLSPAEEQAVRGVRRKLEVTNTDGCAFKRRRDSQLHPSPFERIFSAVFQALKDQCNRMSAVRSLTIRHENATSIIWLAMRFLHQILIPVISSRTPFGISDPGKRNCNWFTKRDAMMSHALATALAIPTPKPRGTDRSPLGRLGPSPRPSVRLAAVGTAAAPPAAELERRKLDLLQAVQETQRGLAATADQRSAVEEALVCVEEYDAGSPVNLSELDGTWRLNYTSASDVLVLFEAAVRLPFLQVGQIFQKFECKDRSDGGMVRNVELEGATLVVSAKFSVLSKRNIFLEFEEVAVENIRISEELQALIAPAILPRSYLSLQILQFIRTFRTQVPVSGPERRSPGGLYYLSYLDRDMLLGRAVGGGGVFVFTKAQPITLQWTIGMTSREKWTMHQLRSLHALVTCASPTESRARESKDPRSLFSASPRLPPLIEEEEPKLFRNPRSPSMEPEDRDNHVVNFLCPTDCSSLPPPLQDDNGGDATAVGACIIDEPHLLRSPFASDAAAVEETLPKRKRGRPRKAYVAGGRKPASKRVEEVCFVCYGGGDLLVCDRRGCLKVYHPTCVNRDQAFFHSQSRWECGWHTCSICKKAATYKCYTCTYSLCKGCIREARYFCVRGRKGFCETCYRTTIMIESNGESNEEKGRLDFDNRNSLEYLFNVYWLTLKGKLSLTLEELGNAKDTWKGSGTSVYNEETSDELYDANDDEEASSDSSPGCDDGSNSSRKKFGGHSRKPTDVEGPADNEKKSLTEDSEWATPELLGLVAHMKNGDKSVMSQFDVQALLLEYIKQNKLRDPHRKSQIVSDTRLYNLFGKARVGHFEMLKLLESHFLIKEASQASTHDNHGGTVDSQSGQTDAEEYNNITGMVSDKRQKTRKRVEREPQFNLEDYAAIDVHNINLIYLRRSLMEDLINDDSFSKKVVGSFVRIRISCAAGQKQDMYRLVQVMGTHVVAEKYKVGKKTIDIAVEILNLDKIEILSIDALSNQEFTEEECKRLRQSIKCGLISRLTVGDVLQKAKVLQEVRIKDVLSTPEERQRRVNEVPEIHVDPNMDPNYESLEEEADTDREDANYFIRSRKIKGKELLSPHKGGSKSNYHAAKDSSTSWLSNRNTQEVGTEDKIEAVVSPGDRKNEASWSDGNVGWVSLETPKEHVHSTKLESSVWNSKQFSNEVPLASNISEDDKVWHYQDPSGRIQGPFSMMQLQKWSSTGYFPQCLRIWLTSQKQENSVLLTDVLLKILKDSQQEPQLTCYSQPANLAGATAHTRHEWNIGWRGNENPALVGLKQNDDHYIGNQSDIIISATGFSVSDAVRYAPQSANYGGPNRELMTHHEGRIGSYPRVWNTSKDMNSWHGQPTSYNSPSPSSSFSRNPCNIPDHQVVANQAGNAERWNRNQDHGSSWSSIRSRPVGPSGQSYEERHSTRSFSSQQSNQNFAQY
ncbi:Plus3 [Musa troglodytarum]|uniref:Plus3 n=1 Tax=Musa troglodytarum TaxID=320322 RepID=A0A9E7JDZ2_9LILI|nr:Plus3 [Musa troglodytarum]